MLARILKRTFFGFLLGMAAGNIIAYFTCAGTGSIVAEELIKAVGDESAALLLQTLLSGLIGAAGVGGMLLYDIDSWSMPLIMFVHLMAVYAVFIPAALILRWVNSAGEMLIMAGIMAVWYFIIWLIMMAVYKAQVKDLNKMQEQLLNGTNKREVSHEENEV